MITQCARVLSLGEDTIQLRFIRDQGCARCAQGQGCGGAVFNALSNSSVIDFSVPRTLELNVGDEVRIGIAARSLVKASFFAYFFPLIGMLISAVVAHFLFNNEVMVVGFALIGLLVSFFAVRGWQKRRQHDFQHIILGVISSR